MPDTVDRLNAPLESRYRIERELGQGGMATDYPARDNKHNRDVARKVLRKAETTMLEPKLASTDAARM